MGPGVEMSSFLPFLTLSSLDYEIYGVSLSEVL